MPDTPAPRPLTDLTAPVFKRNRDHVALLHSLLTTMAISRRMGGFYANPHATYFGAAYDAAVLVWSELILTAEEWDVFAARHALHPDALVPFLADELPALRRPAGSEW